MTETRAFGAESTTDEVLEGQDLGGTTVLVTGASAGLGVETVRSLAAHGASVVGVVRVAAKGENALAGAGVEGDVELVEADLASLSSVRTFTDRFLDRGRPDRIDVLIANAGVMACPEGKTADGFETQFGTNHLGHFVLVNRLLPLLLTGAPARIVNLSSAGHRFSDVDVDDPNFETTPYDPWVAYGRSKTANVLFAVELDRRLRDRGVRATAVHPGGIVTELGRHLTEETIASLQAARGDRKMTWKSVPQGAATSVWAGFVAPASEVGGRYCEDCAVSPVVEDQVQMPGVMGYALDAGSARRLWARSEVFTVIDEQTPSTMGPVPSQQELESAHCWEGEDRPCRQRSSRSRRRTVTVSPASLPIFRRSAALIGNLCRPSPNAMNDAWNGWPSTSARTFTSPRVPKNSAEPGITT